MTVTKTDHQRSNAHRFCVCCSRCKTEMLHRAYKLLW